MHVLDAGVLHDLLVLQGRRNCSVQRRSYHTQLLGKYTGMSGAVCGGVQGLLYEWLRAGQQVLQRGLSCDGPCRWDELRSDEPYVCVPRLRRRRCHPGQVPRRTVERPDGILHAFPRVSRRRRQSHFHHLRSGRDLCSHHKQRWRLSDHSFLHPGFLCARPALESMPTFELRRRFADDSQLFHTVRAGRRRWRSGIGRRRARGRQRGRGRRIGLAHRRRGHRRSLRAPAGSPAACANIPEISVRNIGRLKIIQVSCQRAGDR